ncbi:thiamine-phosphate kinase [Brevibacterium sanguinis]|uniref:Thiamine-monophosphate kinase n=2 Tax=Brevibacterium TaxID=1696 RepID=A0A366INJ3_9MICO|nr:MULTISPECIES: thiamine-monophosphate kinase [Brevibacterium]RBP67948.1 thiamine-phosphate kinase [Brevibacterium sanguinis]RBP74635.1 thiamine-phosphate kinase [Brevibacterium celere]
MTRLSELGESHVLSRILGHNRDGAHVIVGPGDDAAVTALSGNLVSTADMLVENEDFTRDWLDWHRLGIKAAAQNLADVCAMGAVPHGLLVSLAVPDDTDIADLEALFTGILAEASRAGSELGCEVPIVGGDLSSSGLIVVAITALGTVGPGAALTRSGARPGDAIHLAGTVGRAAAGLDLLFARDELRERALSEITAPDPASTVRSRLTDTGEPELARLIAAQLAAQPDYAAVPRMAGRASAMIDVSDGLSTDLRRIADASGVHAALESAALDELVDDLMPAVRFLFGDGTDAEDRAAPGSAAARREFALEWVLNGGEDHGFVATAAPDLPPPVGWRRIGEVTAGSGLSLDGDDLPTSGFSHFGK